jgi:hypothetical protein
MDTGVWPAAAPRGSATSTTTIPAAIPVCTAAPSRSGPLVSRNHPSSDSRFKCPLVSSSHPNSANAWSDAPGSAATPTANAWSGCPRSAAAPQQRMLVRCSLAGQQQPPQHLTSQSGVPPGQQQPPQQQPPQQRMPRLSAAAPAANAWSDTPLVSSSSHPSKFVWSGQPWSAATTNSILLAVPAAAVKCLSHHHSAGKYQYGSNNSQYGSYGALSYSDTFSSRPATQGPDAGAVRPGPRGKGIWDPLPEPRKQSGGKC